MPRIAAIAALAIAGCFTPSHDRCTVSCAADQSCPTGFSCLSDGFCHASEAESLCAITTDAGVDAPVDAGPGCGDGIRQTDLAEECDDNNTDDGDGCSAICREESGFVCVGGPGELSTCRPNPSQAGDLVITEALASPSGPTDLTHEWFEIFNPTTTDFDLDGMQVDEITGVETFTVNRSLVIEAGGHLVLGRNDDPDANGGVDVAFAYGGAYALAASDDEIVLSFDGVVIDEVDLPIATDGAAESLSGQTYDAVSNDDVGNWCDADDSFGDNGDLGTPGMLNPDCP